MTLGVFWISRLMFIFVAAGIVFFQFRPVSIRLKSPRFFDPWMEVHMKSIDISPSLLRISAVPTVQLKYQTFHPSIWPKMIGEVSRDAMAGSFVLVLGKEGTPFGWGLWNPKSRMPLRIVSHSLEVLDDETFFENAIRRVNRVGPRGLTSLQMGRSPHFNKPMIECDFARTDPIPRPHSRFSSKAVASS